jgi:hypothetical protein
VKWLRPWPRRAPAARARAPKIADADAAHGANRPDGIAGAYVRLFDRGRALSLHLFEHIHGESRDRGQAMVNLLEVYRQHGFELSARELPDYMPLFLEYLAQRPQEEALDMLADTLHVMPCSAPGWPNGTAIITSYSTRSPRWWVNRRTLRIFAAGRDRGARSDCGEYGQDLGRGGGDISGESGRLRHESPMPGAPQPCNGFPEPGSPTACLFPVKPPLPPRGERIAFHARQTIMSYLDTLFFGVYPYLAGAVFLLGSLMRFDRDQFTWKAHSSQMLSNHNMRWASNLFHVGILLLFLGHFVGLLTPPELFHAWAFPPAPSRFWPSSPAVSPD